jgi:hypothetical protein
MQQQNPPGPDYIQPALPGGPSIVEELFVREDLSKPENRANVLLLAAASISPFWSRLHCELRLAADTVLRPERNTAVGRPDLVARSPNGTRIAVIECENCGENKNQSVAYARWGVPLILIVGTTRKPDRGTTWARIRDMITEVRETVEPRQRVILDLLGGAISDILHLRPRSQPYAIGQADLPAWLKVAAAPLLELGEAVVGLHTVADGSASVRLAGPNWAFRNKPINGVFLAMSQRVHGGTVFPAGPRHLERHLSDHLQAWVGGRWTDTLRGLTGGIVAEDGSGRVAVMTGVGTATAEEIAAVFTELVAALRAHPEGTRPA